MSKILPPNLEPLNASTPKAQPAPSEPETLTPAAEGEKMELKKQVDATARDEEEEEMVSSASLEPSTLQWPEKGLREAPKEGDPAEEQTARGEGEGASVRSDAPPFGGRESWTESEPALGSATEGNAPAGGASDEVELKEAELKESGLPGPLEEDEEGVPLNTMPEKAAQVFLPSVTIRPSSVPQPRSQSLPHWERDEEKSPFLDPQGTPPDGYYHDWQAHQPHQKCSCLGSHRDALKLGVSVFTAAIIFPFLVWGGYVFLPFDAPLMDSAPHKLVYTLRCSVFAMVPIILGWLVLGISRLRFGSVRPLCEAGVEVREVSVHRHYVDDSLALFQLYFLQLAVMAAYLSQHLLKLVPLLTIVFAFGRLVYWVGVALGSSVRGFGFGMSFLPALVMLGANLYFVFIEDSAGSIFAQDDPAQSDTSQSSRQRFWG